MRYLKEKYDALKAGTLLLVEHDLIEEEYGMGRKLQWDFDAWDIYCEWQRMDKATLKRINAILSKTFGVTHLTVLASQSHSSMTCPACDQR